MGFLRNVVLGAPGPGEKDRERYAFGEALTRAERHTARVREAQREARLRDQVDRAQQGERR